VFVAALFDADLECEFVLAPVLEVVVHGLLDFLAFQFCEDLVLLLVVVLPAVVGQVELLHDLEFVQNVEHVLFVAHVVAVLLVLRLLFVHGGRLVAHFVEQVGVDFVVVAGIHAGVDAAVGHVVHELLLVQHLEFNVVAFAFVVPVHHGCVVAAGDLDVAGVAFLVHLTRRVVQRIFIGDFALGVERTCDLAPGMLVGVGETFFIFFGIRMVDIAFRVVFLERNV